MIRFGSRIIIKAICPDCDKPMETLEQSAYSGIAHFESSDFASVSCNTEDCINRYFVTTIERKSGTVLFTDARYKSNYETANQWEPMYPVYKTAEELKKE